jgi:hypothetical protein
MTHSVPAFGTDQTLLPNQSFFAWLRTQTTLFISQILALLTFISFLASLIYYVHDVTEVGEKASVFELTTINLFIDFAHIVLIVIFIVALIQVLDDNVRGSYRVGLVYDRVFKTPLKDDLHKKRLEDSRYRLRRFKTYFLCFWCVMLALYIAFAFKHSLTIKDHNAEPALTRYSWSQTESQGSGSERATIQFNWNEEISSPSDPAAAESHALDSEHEPPEWLKDKVFPFLTFALNNISLMFIFFCFAVLLEPTHKRRRRVRRFVAVGIVVFTFSYLLLFNIHELPTLRASQAAFDAVSGVLNALALALLIARLDSKLIGLPSWLIFVLYSYAAVQPLFVAFEQQSEVFESIETAVLIVVFISKIYFFLIIFYALQTGRMLNYFYCFPFLNERVDTYMPDRSGVNTGSKWTVPSWLEDAKTLLIATAVSIILIGLFGLLVYLLIGGPQHSATYILLLATDAFNLVIVRAMIFLLWRMLSNTSSSVTSVQELFRKIFAEPLSNPADLVETSKKQVLRFKHYFLWFWRFTWLLYLAVMARHAGLWYQAIEPQHQLSTGQIFIAVVPSFLEFTLSTLNMVCIFWCFVVLYLPAHDDRADKKQKLVIRYSRFIVALLIAAFLLLLCSLGPDRMTLQNLNVHKTVFNGISGTLSAIVLALLIARLDSKIISLSSWLVTVLFGYSAVQALSVVFDLKEFYGIETVTLIFALVFKVSFFLIVVYALQTGKVLNYLACFPSLDKRVDSIFDNQFEIRTLKNEYQMFTYSIWKRNKLVYSTEAAFHSKSDCDRSVEWLRAVMAYECFYTPDNSSGTFWVRVTDAYKNLLCESVSLRSAEEARELIHESVEKIRWCKYERV